MTSETITKTVRDLSDQLVNNWPLYSFVTSNPLSGLEDRPFDDAIREMRNHLNINGYPSADAFKQVWDRGEIDKNILEKQLQAKGITYAPAESLKAMNKLEKQTSGGIMLNKVDRQLVKWLGVFMDQGSTEWPMPNREEGFYKAWKKSARYDHTLPNRNLITSLPDDPEKAIKQLLEPRNFDDLHTLFKSHLLALPGWTGYIKYRMENPSDWQESFPITLTDYLAVRFTICMQFGNELLSDEQRKDDNDRRSDQDKIKLAWLEAMEQTYRRNLAEKLASQEDHVGTEKQDRPEGQFVFCIDTRSERIRRAVEQAGPFETFGYAGFFGVAMDYQHPEKNISHKSCPPIVESQFKARENTRPDQESDAEHFDFYNNLTEAFNEFRFTLKNNIPASFGYVESSGFLYGLGMIIRTMMPDAMFRLSRRAADWMGHPEWFSNAVLSKKASEETSATPELSVPEKTQIAKAAFDLMGWEQFAPLVIFAGHGSQTSNNPFGSSLDCGACAGNKGRHNARVLADICNDKQVRSELSEQHDIQIPDDTLFVAAEHNTTTNAIDFFDQHIPKVYRSKINQLKKRLNNAQAYANIEQFNMPGEDTTKITDEAHRRVADWAETRPEWGLAGNASFIIGPRSLTSRLNLEARSFLHTYDWKKDPDGQKLEAIFQGPMVVTQWINNHYYFAAVDNDVFGSGTKVTQNVTGKFGVVQGNGGDLKLGLPLESLREDDQQLQHIPMRLSVFIYAPKSRVKNIMDKHPDSLARLVENGWIHLSVIDPTQENEISELDLNDAQLEYHSAVEEFSY